MVKQRRTVTDLRVALEAFQPSGPEFGEDDKEEGISNKGDLTQFRNDLQSVSNKNKIYFVICIAALVVLFIGALGLIVYFIHTPGNAAAVFTVTGVSFAGISAQMVSLWRKKVTSDLLLVLAGQLRSSDLKSITDVLLREYFK